MYNVILLLCDHDRVWIIAYTVHNAKWKTCVRVSICVYYPIRWPLMWSKSLYSIPIMYLSVYRNRISALGGHGECRKIKYHASNHHTSVEYKQHIYSLLRTSRTLEAQKAWKKFPCSHSLAHSFAHWWCVLIQCIGITEWLISSILRALLSYPMFPTLCIASTQKKTKRRNGWLCANKSVCATSFPSCSTVCFFSLPIFHRRKLLLM